MGILGWHPAAGRESEFWLDLAKGGWMDGGHPLNWIHKLQHFHLMVSGRDWSHIQHSHNLMGRISRIFDTRLFQQFRLWDYDNSQTNDCLKRFAFSCIILFPMVVCGDHEHFQYIREPWTWRLFGFSKSDNQKWLIHYEAERFCKAFGLFRIWNLG